MVWITVRTALLSRLLLEIKHQLLTNQSRAFILRRVTGKLVPIAGDLRYKVRGADSLQDTITYYITGSFTPRLWTLDKTSVHGGNPQSTGRTCKFTNNRGRKLTPEPGCERHKF